MKKLLCGFLIGIITSFCIGVYANNVLKATPATFDILVNGEKFIDTEKPAVAIEGSTYLPLRAMGKALNVPVEWNAELKRVEVGKKKTVTSIITEQKNFVVKSNSIKIYNQEGIIKVINKDNKYYLSAELVREHVTNKDKNVYLSLPKKESVLILDRTNSSATATNYSLMKDGRLYIDIEACGLKWNLDGDTLWVEV